MSPSNDDWSEDKTKQLLFGWGNSLTNSELAEDLGITRSSVAGKLNRLGLYRERPERKVKKEIDIILDPDDGIPIFNGISPVDGKFNSEDITTLFKVKFRKVFHNLGYGDCKFPVGDPLSASFFFCGAPVDIGDSYCPRCNLWCYLDASEFNEFLMEDVDEM